MRILKVLLLISSLSFTVLAESGSIKKMAVLPFFISESDTAYAPLSKGLADMISTDLSQVKRWTLLERSEVRALADEIALGQSGALDEYTTVKESHIVKADAVVKGSFSKSDDNSVSLTAEINGMIPVTEKGDIKTIFKMEKALVFGIVNMLGVILTPEERKKIEVVATEDVLAFLAYSRGLDAEDKGDNAKAAECFSEAAARDPGYKRASDAVKRIKKEERNNSYGTKPTAVFTTGMFTVSAENRAAAQVLNMTNAVFMPEKAVETTPAKNGFLEVQNIGIGAADGNAVDVKVPIPDIPQ
ncbi:MAG: hypothetical protein JNL74_07470 [Fibrobacteres bacterium]|nr:hypothetical protein [Fibrobacterota bacterium]